MGKGLNSLARSLDHRTTATVANCHDPTDRSWAKWLYRRLETYRTPRSLRRQGNRERLRRVFRNEDELAASTDLGSRIDEALRSSKFLIVISSFQTPASRWVREEIERFIRMGRGGNILTLLVGGACDRVPSATIHGDDRTGAFGRPRRTSGRRRTATGGRKRALSIPTIRDRVA